MVKPRNFFFSDTNSIGFQLCFTPTVISLCSANHAFSSLVKSGDNLEWYELVEVTFWPLQRAWIGELNTNIKVNTFAIFKTFSSVIGLILVALRRFKSANIKNISMYIYLLYIGRTSKLFRQN